METDTASAREIARVSSLHQVVQEREGVNAGQVGSISEILCDMLTAALHNDETPAQG